MKASVKIVIAAIFFAGPAINSSAQKVKTEEKTKTQKTQTKTVAAILEKNTLTSDFYSYLKRDKLTEDLNSDTKIYTIFAPANSVFTPATPAGQATGMNTIKPEVPANWADSYIVEGSWDVNAIMEQIKANNWKAQLTARNGNTLWATIENGAVKLTDDKGNSARIIKYNYMASNGVVHIIEGQLPMSAQPATAAPAAASGK